MALLIPAQGNAREVYPAHGKAFTLVELQAAVGGYIEVLRIGVRFMFLNEHGKLHGLPRNDYATTMAWAAGTLPPLDWIVGDVLVCTLIEAGEGDGDGE
jgi:hypothetical protein